jgi:hypothetical protein
MHWNNFHGQETLLMEERVDAKRMWFRKEANQVLQASPQPVYRPSHHQIEAALSGVSAKRIESGALVSTFRAADSTVFVDLDDLTSDAQGNRS